MYTGVGRTDSLLSVLGWKTEPGSTGRVIVMDVSKILAELKAEREQIEEAIQSLERLARGRGRGPGRPPHWMSETALPKRRGRPPGSKNKVQPETMINVASASSSQS